MVGIKLNSDDTHFVIFPLKMVQGGGYLEVMVLEAIANETIHPATKIHLLHQEFTPPTIL